VDTLGVLILPGAALLTAGIILDRHAEQGSRQLGCAPDAYWRAVLSGVHPGLRAGRHLLGWLPAGPRCKLCHAPFGGIGGPLMRLCGKRPSDKNPQFCGDCLMKTPLGGAEITLSLLTADVRGSTGLAEQISPGASTE